MTTIEWLRAAPSERQIRLELGDSMRKATALKALLRVLNKLPEDESQRRDLRSLAQ